jgi:ADP-ribose diphosphatase
MDMIKKWDLLKTTEIESNRVFSVRQDTALSPLTGKEHDFYIIDAPDWINVVAVTPEEEILLIKQFRHGIRAVTVEIPGGMIDPGEAPIEAAKRELLEETGYKAQKWFCIGEVVPNPAIQDNKCYTFLAQSAVKVKEPEFDNTEDIQTFSVAAADIPNIVAQGRITHSLVIAAFYWYHLHITSDS